MSKHVLIVEDDDVIRRVLRLSLEKFGYTVEVAPDGLEALEALERGTIDGMVLDLFLPRLNGFEVLRQLQDTRPQLPVVTISGHPEHTDQAFKAGAKAFLCKPFSQEELRQTVERWIGLP